MGRHSQRSGGTCLYLAPRANHRVFSPLLRACDSGTGDRECVGRQPPIPSRLRCRRTRDRHCHLIIVLDQAVAVGALIVANQCGCSVSL